MNFLVGLLLALFSLIIFITSIIGGGYLVSLFFSIPLYFGAFLFAVIFYGIIFSLIVYITQQDE